MGWDEMGWDELGWDGTGRDDKQQQRQTSMTDNDNEKQRPCTRMNSNDIYRTNTMITTMKMIPSIIIIMMMRCYNSSI